MEGIADPFAACVHRLISLGAKRVGKKKKREGAYRHKGHDSPEYSRPDHHQRLWRGLFQRGELNFRGFLPVFGRWLLLRNQEECLVRVRGGGFWLCRYVGLKLLRGSISISRVDQGYRYVPCEGVVYQRTGNGRPDAKSAGEKCNGRKESDIPASHARIRAFNVSTSTGSTCDPVPP